MHDAHCTMVAGNVQVEQAIKAIDTPSWSTVRTLLEQQQTPEERQFRDNLSKGSSTKETRKKISESPFLETRPPGLRAEHNCIVFVVIATHISFAFVLLHRIGHSTPIANLCAKRRRRGHVVRTNIFRQWNLALGTVRYGSRHF